MSGGQLSAGHDFKKMLQLALYLYLLIHSFVFCVEIVYKHAFSLLSKLVPGAVDFFYNCYCHITDTVALFIEVGTCCFS